MSRGKWSGLSAVKISKLLGASIWITKQLLYKLTSPTSDEDIGNLIYEYRSKKELTKLNKYFR